MNWSAPEHLKKVSAAAAAPTGLITAENPVMGLE